MASAHVSSAEQVDLAFVIETPENVALQLHTAGPASRAPAQVLDLFVCYAVVFVCIVAINILGIATGNAGLGVGITFVILFLAQWFYFVISEWLFRGKTIGKYACGLRVVRDGGYPIGFWQALLRNLVRAADNLPFLSGFGLVSMSVTGAKFQRLGDLLAGTVVIRETPFRLPTEPIILERIQPLPRTELGAWTPSSRTLALIESFLGRRHVLTYQRGHELALTLAEILAKRLNFSGDSAAVTKYPMGFLARVFVTFQRQLNDEGDAQETTDGQAATAGVSTSAAKTPSATPTAASSAEAAVRTAGSVANKRAFIRRRRTAWRDFTRLLELFESTGRGKAKTPAAAADFSRLFREVCFDLSLVRSRDWGRGLDGFLNQLVIRGHNIFYRSPPARWSAVWNYLSEGFPRLFRRRAGYFAVAAGLFFGSFFATWWIVQTHPPLAASILPAQALEQMDAMYDEDKETNEDEKKKGSPLNSFGDQRSMMVGFYIQNNVGIALDCFGRGALFGIGTIYILLANGISIGAVFGHLVAGGRGNKLLTFVLSHGSFELTAIAVAGGAGLMLGDAVLRPGNRRLVDSLKHRGWEAVQIAMGAAVMLVIAAFIEAFWSPSALPQGIKLAGGTAFWLLVAAYLGLAGRRADAAAGGSRHAD